MFIRENGKEEKGWRGTPFYWPVLLVQENVRPAIYGISAEREGNSGRESGRIMSHDTGRDCAERL